MTAEEIDKIASDYLNDCESELDMIEVFAVAKEALEQEPKTGHWIAIDEEPHEDYECDKCAFVVSAWTADIEPEEVYKYCPNCGAKMEVEDATDN